MEINASYVDMAKERLEQPFYGFDSIDQRMERVPNDLNDPVIRQEYIKNHIRWFLHNHPDRIEKFMHTVNKKYAAKMVQLELSSS